LEAVGLDRRIILKWVFKKWNVEAWTGLIWLRLGTDVRAVVNVAINIWVP
jgi:hypothetical protein